MRGHLKIKALYIKIRTLLAFIQKNFCHALSFTQLSPKKYLSASLRSIVKIFAYKLATFKNFIKNHKIFIPDIRNSFRPTNIVLTIEFTKLTK